jgi:hypothetical protein
VADCFSLRELARQIDLLDNRETTPPDRGAARCAHELDRILAAAHRGKIRTLWVREGASIPGRIERKTGRAMSAQGRDGDVLDCLVAQVLRTGGALHLVAAHRMPGGAHALALLS